MKKWITMIYFFFMSIAVPCAGEEFMGAPVVDGGHTIRAEKGLVEKSYDLSINQILNQYRDSLKGQEDLKFRERMNQFDVEDHGRRPWHKITISRNEKGQTAVLITRDSWSWIIGMLFIRFIGVFVVLLVLYLAMNTATSLISLSIRGGRKASAICL